MTRNKHRKPVNAVNNIQPVQPGAKISQEPVGTEVFTSSSFKWVWPRVDTKLIEDYADNALLAEPLKNCVELIFTSHEDHPTPWVTVKDPEGNIDDELSKQGQQIAKVCEFYPAHIRAFYDQELGGCSVWSPGWGTIDGVTGICPVELRNLPWNSFRELPTGFMDVYNDIMPGIVIDKSTNEVRIFQKQDDRSTPVEILQTPNLPSWIIVRDPVTPKPSGKPGCLPVLTLITNYNYADKAWNQKMNRIASPILMLQIQTALTAKIEEYAKNVVQKWGKDTGFLLTKDMLPVDPHLVESQTAEERLAWLQKRINSYYNPASFLQREGNSIGGADTGAERLINNRTVSVLSRLENGLGETLLNIWLNVNGFVGYSAEVRYPRPDTKNDTQTLAEITEANRNGQISRIEARELYPNLDLPELTPEEEAKMDAEYEKRKPAQNNPFGGGAFGSQEVPTDTVGNIRISECPPHLYPNAVSNLSPAMPVSPLEAELLAATRQCAADVKRIVKEQIGSMKP
jgi:hypothetical protein